MTHKPVPRLFTAIRRLGLQASTAAYVVHTARDKTPEGFLEAEIAKDLIRVAILQRHMRLAIHRNAQRDPSERRKGFGRFPRGFAPESPAPVCHWDVEPV